MSVLNPNLILTKSIIATYFNRFTTDANNALPKLIANVLEK